MQNLQVAFAMRLSLMYVLVNFFSFSVRQNVCQSWFIDAETDWHLTGAVLISVCRSLKQLPKWRLEEESLQEGRSLDSGPFTYQK